MMGTLVRIGRPILIFCSGFAMSNFRQIDRGRHGSMLVVATELVQAPNDKQQLAPMLDKLSALTDHLGDAETLLATTVITGDISRQHGRQPPTRSPVKKSPLIGNSAQRMKACRVVLGGQCRSWGQAEK